MYTEAAAAAHLRVPVSTLHYWLEGGTKAGRTYRPVIREEPTGTRTVTWAEFVEAGLLLQCRRVNKVLMQELRAFIDGLRERLQVPYPLAHFKPFAEGRVLLLEEQTNAGLGAEFALVAQVSGQYVLLPAAQQFVDRITWADDIAMAWRPADDPDSQVIIDPDIRSGRPSSGGISTAILWEQSEGGETESDLAGTYEITVAQVRWALSYEQAARAA